MRSISRRLAASWRLATLALLLGACRGAAHYGGFELEGASLIGLRRQPGWEHEDAPLLHLDAAARPLSWPVGVKVSTSLSGYFGDAEGAQTGGLGLGLTRSFELMPDRLAGSLGLGRLFLTTDNGDLLVPETDGWQANYVEAGLYWLVEPESEFGIGLEVRYSSGDGPDLGATRLDGDSLDLFLVARFGWPGSRRAPPP